MANYPSQRAVGAALFLLARQYFPDWEGWPKSEAEVVLLAGVGRREVYEAREDLLDRLYDFLWEPEPDAGEVFSGAVAASSRPSSITTMSIPTRLEQ